MVEEWDKYILPAAWFIGGIGAGIVTETIILRKLNRSAMKSRWKGDEVILQSFRTITFCWFALFGAYMFLHRAPFSPVTVVYLNKLIFALVVLTISVLLARMTVGFIRLKSKAASHFPSTSIISNIVRITIYAIEGMIVLQAFGVSVTPVLTALGVGALAVALALQETLSNLFAGLQVIASRQIKIGDYIKLDSGDEGYVTDITWRNTVIRALANNNIVVPNSKIASAIVTNYYRPEKEMAVLVELGVGYNSDLDKVEEVTIAAGKEVLINTTGGVPDFEPFIRFHTFGDSAIRFSVILRGKEFTDQYLIKHQFVKTVMERYREYGIEIPFPMRTVVLKKGNDDGK